MKVGRSLLAALLLAALLGLGLAACTTAPQIYPLLHDKAVSLRAGDLEAQGLAFITPSTVTGQEHERQAVALTFADVLRGTRPVVRVTTLAETLGAVNQAGLADTYRQMYEDYRDTGLFSAQALRRVGEATGARYLAQLNLQTFNQGAKGRLSVFGLRLMETHFADVRLFFQVWDSRDGTIAWEAMQELRIAVDSTREEPVMLRRLLERGAQELVARMP